MVTGDIVPLESVIVKVVQNGQARFIVALGSLSIVWLGLTVSASVTPVAGVALRG